MRILQEFSQYRRRAEHLCTSVAFSGLGGLAIGVAPDIPAYAPEFGIVSVPILVGLGVFATAIAISEFDNFLNPDSGNEL